MGSNIYRPMALKSEVCDHAAPIAPPINPKPHLPAVLPERGASLSARLSMVWGFFPHQHKKIKQTQNAKNTNAIMYYNPL